MPGNCWAFFCLKTECKDIFFKKKTFYKQPFLFIEVFIKESTLDC